MRRMFAVPLLIAAPLAGLAYMAPRTAAAEEWEENTVYYEDDAWYDITEWLDGNDYNPTDEVPGLWDDEDYDWAAVETDADSDVAAGYGYDDNNLDDDWYYDYYGDYDYGYYDYLDEDGVYDYVYDYYDYDDDGYYDAVASFQDEDGDGLFDDYDYYAFNVSTTTGESQDSGNQAAANKKQEPKARGGSKQFQASGTVEKTKRVQVRNGGQRLIVQLKNEQGKMFFVDLGRPQELTGQQGQQNQQNQQDAAQQSQNQPVKQGDKLTAKGPAIKVGDKQVVLAQTVTINNQQEQQISRSGRTINGEVAKLKTAKVRGQQHQMAIIDLQSGKQALVDMGPADKLQAGLKEGDQVQVSGVPVKVQDRFVFLANAVSKNGQKTKIDRVAAMPAGESS